MKKVNTIVLAIFLGVLVSASWAASTDYKKAEADAKKPVNCATAEADIRVLNSEKAHAADQIADGVTAIMPIGLVFSTLTGTEGAKASVATGDYNKMLDDKIAEIKKQCGVK
jgi:hypothetical protein